MKLMSVVFLLIYGMAAATTVTPPEISRPENACVNAEVVQSGLTGRWKFTVDFKGLGKMEFLVDFNQTSDTTFEASSRHKAMKELVGYPKYLLAKTFVKQFKYGALVHVFNGKMAGDSLKGVFTAPTIGLYFDGKLGDHVITGVLGDRKSMRIDFTAVPYESDSLKYDYAVLAAAIRQTFEDNIYNPRILQRRDWKKFFRKLDKRIPDIHDDVELFVAFSALSAKLKTSHVGILKYNPLEQLAHPENDTSETESLVEHRLLSPQTAYLRFPEFSLSDTTVVRSFFSSIIQQQVPNLIIDLRGCAGGDQSSMLPASYLITAPADAGVFVGNKYFRTTQQLPDAAVICAIPPFEGGSLLDFLQTLLDNGLLAGKVVPDKELHYAGKVVVLTDEDAVSAAEPLAYFLKQHRLATLAGETTGGKMLSAMTVKARDSWFLYLPIADYYTSDGYRIEQKGVKPDIKVRSENALEYTLEKILDQPSEGRTGAVKQRGNMPAFAFVKKPAL